MPRLVAGNLTHSKVLSSIPFDLQANNEFNNHIAHDWKSEGKSVGGMSFIVIVIAAINVVQRTLQDDT